MKQLLRRQAANIRAINNGYDEAHNRQQIAIWPSSCTTNSGIFLALSFNKSCKSQTLPLEEENVTCKYLCNRDRTSLLNRA
jgi:hypothetical protein